MMFCKYKTPSKVNVKWQMERYLLWKRNTALQSRGGDKNLLYM